MWPNRVSNPGPLAFKSDALPTRYTIFLLHSSQDSLIWCSKLHLPIGCIFFLLAIMPHRLFEQYFIRINYIQTANVRGWAERF